MPAFSSFSAEQIADIVAFLHSRAASTHGNRLPETSLLVGDAQKGQAYFNGKGGCSGCHSTTGDLAHLGSKYAPLNLTMAFLTPAAKEKVAKVTLPSGRSVSGKLTYLDEFTVLLTDESGAPHSWSRDSLQSVEVIAPLAVHAHM